MKDVMNRRAFGATKSGKTLPNERTFKVRTKFYDHQLINNDPLMPARQVVPVPWINLQGYWMIEAGFSCDTQFVAKISKGEIVLTVRS